MALTPGSDDLYKRIAATILRDQTPSQIAAPPAAGSQFNIAPIAPVEGEGSPERWSLGQGIIDVLSSGTYLTAGVGRKIGENIQEAQGGNAWAALDIFNPISTLLSGVQGIGDRQTWSENLKDWGVEEGPAAGAGLALDIALDPLWLIPGGAIAAGAKGVAKGVALSSAASKEGVKLTPKAIEEARKATEGFQKPLLTDNLSVTDTGVKVSDTVADFFPATGQRIPIYSTEGLTNLIQGVKNSTVDEYARWGTARQLKKDKKAGIVNGQTEESSAILNEVLPQTPLGAPAATAKPAARIDETLPPAEQAAKQIEDVVEREQNSRMVPDTAKDAEASPQTVAQAVESQDIKKFARDNVEPAKVRYIEQRNIDGGPKIDFDKVEVSPLAGKIADEYRDAVSDPTNPEVIRAYNALKAEIREQYDYMTNELGIRVEFTSTDPYNVRRADGTSYPSPKEMMRDVTENKRLQVRDSAPDFALDPHPLLTVEENNMFRAVHDFFGHAGSGRGFLADGEEAAWVSHSQMFTPEARRAMTTETRGQNSYYNKYGEFAPQKAILLSDEYVMLPSEYSELERRVGSLNTFIGAKTAALVELEDRLLPDLGLVSSPIQGSKLYTPEQLAQAQKKLEELSQPGTFGPKSEEAVKVGKLFTEVERLLKGDIVRTGATGKLTDFLRIGEDALFVDQPGRQGSSARAMAILRNMLDEPVDATELLESALRAEGRTLSTPKPFKPTIWGAPAKEGTVTKPLFSRAKLEKYFADDELLRDPDQLRLAMGETKFKPGSAGSKKAAEQQQIIWENFRARNHDILAEVVERERNDWFAENSVEASTLFTQMSDGTVIGQGLLPESIPYGTLYTHNGRPTTTLAALLENLGQVVNRTGPQMGGLPTSRISGAAIGGRTGRIADERGRPLEVAGAPVLREGAGEVVTPEVKKLRAALKARGRDIQLDTYPVALQKWLLDEVDKLSKSVKTKGVVDQRIFDEATDVETMVTRLWNELPFLKSRADARKMVTLGPKGFAQLAKAPARKYFIDGEMDRLIGGVDVASIGKAASTAGKGQKAKVVSRDPETGAPLDAKGNPVPENAAEVAGPENQYRILAEGGKAYTGRLASRKGSMAAPQTGEGAQQLAGLQAIRSSLGSISEAINAKAFVASPEQAKFLGSIMGTLGIKVADNATPQKIFTQFSREAQPRFEELVSRIESAAKTDSIAYQAKSVFKRVTEENISILKAIEDLDVADLQQQSVKFTDDAISLIDDTCRAATGRPDILSRVIGDLNG